MKSAPASGATGTIAVATSRDCTWAASSTASWIAITSGTSGQGAGSVAYRVAENPTRSTRRGTVAVNDAQIQIAQDSAPCRFTVSPGGAAMAAAGGTVTVHVDTAAGCEWSAAGGTEWLQVTGASSGSGPGDAAITVAANAGSARSGTVTIAGQTFAVAQAGAGAPTPTPTPTPIPIPPPVTCTYAISPSSRNTGADAAAGTINVITPDGCEWNASSQEDWISLAGGASGTGNGSVAYAIMPNTGPTRRGTIRLAGKSFTVRQSSGCSASISSTGQALDSSGGSGTVGVTIGGGCNWTAKSNDEWISITGSASGSGDGSIAFSVAPNAGSARSGTLTIAGRTFTISQAAGCTFTIAPDSQNVDAPGGSGSVAVTTASGCTWTASSNNTDWLVVADGATGSGSGTVSFNAAANAGAARTGTLTVAGQTFTVAQAAAPPPPPPPPPACTYSIAPADQSTSAAAATGTIALTTGNSCAWTAASNNPEWITITSAASGTGSATITFTVAANETGTARTGTLTVGGQTFTVSQSGTLASSRHQEIRWTAPRAIASGELDDLIFCERAEDLAALRAV